MPRYLLIYYKISLDKLQRKNLDDILDLVGSMTSPWEGNTNKKDFKYR